MPAVSLPAGITFLERGWLSSNNIIVSGADGAALIDTGYATHAQQTVQLVARVLGTQPLVTIACTHLHSDHCGGNAAVQRAWPGARTLIPPGHAREVERWDASALSHEPTGQLCERFSFDGLLQPGTGVVLGRYVWQVHAAPGHDPHSVILFEPESRTLVSADALWQNGFGVVFPELDGADGFREVGATLDLIEGLDAQIVIPGHGAPFDAGSGAIAAALARARQRLASFQADPRKHATHAAKVMLKFKLLELQSLPLDDLLAWAMRTPFFEAVHGRHFAGVDQREWLGSLAGELVRAGVATIEGPTIHNA